MDSAKKRIASERNRAAVFRTKVYLGDQYQRWMLKKEELGETHAGLAKILLDRFAGSLFLLFHKSYVKFN